MGFNYGINNSVGKMSFLESQQLLFKAYSSGVKTLDTAEVYGNAHEVIGVFHKNNPDCKFRIVTKVPHNVKADSIVNKVKEYIEVLEVEYLDVLMFHSFDSFINSQRAIGVLVEAKRQGYIQHIGVSVYTNAQLKHLLNMDCITVVQLPFNLLDNYSVRGNLIEQLKAKEKIVHTRSAFLQGLFFKKTSDENKIVQKLYSELEILHQISVQSNCSMEELALSYCLYQKNIDNVIVGVDSVEHFNSNVKASFYNIEDIIVKKINGINIKDLDLLNPSLW